MKIIEIKNVSKIIKKNKILKNISFDIEEGEIVGLLGLNGAGKSTILKIITGLLLPDTGYVNIFGYDIKKRREKAIENIGCFIETPVMYEYLTAKENLILVSNMYKNITKEKINHIIRLVGLENRINDKVKKYSLGMKQRLGLAQALITEPKILILDEPINGLDPQGIIDFRNIIKNINNNGCTVLISSHILSEIEHLCTKVIFVSKGEIKSVENINPNNKEKILTIIPSNVDDCVNMLSSLEYVIDYVYNDKSIDIKIDIDNFSYLIKNLIDNGINILDMNKKDNFLENRFIEIIKEEV